jgi:hypothetical protein
MTILWKQFRGLQIVHFRFSLNRSSGDIFSQRLAHELSLSVAQPPLAWLARLVCIDPIQ